MKSRRKFFKELIISGALVGFSPMIIQGAPVFSGKESSKKKKFLNACHNGELSLVKEMVGDDPALLKANDKAGRSGFAIALLAGHKDIGDFLKQSGYAPDLHESALDLDWERFEMLTGEESNSTEIEVNRNHPMGGNTMWAAAAGGAGSYIWHIYGKCGDPNGFDHKKGHTTPLQKALRFPDLKIAELTAATLLSNDADPNLAGNGDLPPLHIAAERGSFELVEMLIRLNTHVNEKDQQGRLAVQLVERNGHKKVFDLITSHQTIARTCRTSRTAFDLNGGKYRAPDISEIPSYLRGELVGKSHFDLEYVKKIVSADPRMAHSVATTSEICVEACAHTGRKPIVEYLIEKGAPYSLPTAVMLSDYTTVTRLLDEDPNRINERGAHDFALLWYPVIGQCELKMMELLIERGAKVEQQHFLGTTALHWACRKGPLELIELLIENGADVNRVGRKFTAEGETPLQSTKDEQIKSYLRSKGARS